MNEDVAKQLLAWLSEVRPVAAVAASGALAHSAVRTESELLELMRGEEFASRVRVTGALCDVLADLSEVMSGRFDSLAKRVDGASELDEIHGHLLMTVAPGNVGCASPAALVVRGLALLEQLGPTIPEEPTDVRGAALAN